MAIAILVPALNESRELARTLAALRDHAEEAGGITVFLVDDGSDPPIAPASLAGVTSGPPAFRVVLARHAINLGQGAALETARQLALAAPERFDAFVTMDADGQHRVEDALLLARAVIDGADAAFGNRFLGDSNVPPARRAVLAGARWFERAITGLRLDDAHNGLRAFRRRALERIAIRQNRMAHATEIKVLVSRATRSAGPLRVVEVPVSVRYTPESLAKGQRTTTGAAAILRDLVLHYLFGESS
jgi:glycosyltransferase involved in cell wall biosynthesis